MAARGDDKSEYNVVAHDRYPWLCSQRTEDWYQSESQDSDAVVSIGEGAWPATHAPPAPPRSSKLFQLRNVPSSIMRALVCGLRSIP